MQTFIDFLVNNYFWFLIISLILVFALIGYLVDTSEKPTGRKIEEEPLREKEIENTQIQETNNIVEPAMNNNNIEMESINSPIPTTEIKETNENIFLDDLDNLE